MRLLEFVNLTYTYDGQQPLLRGVSGQLEQGKLYGILGPSGCGKTTLLSLLGGLDSPPGRAHPVPGEGHRGDGPGAAPAPPCGLYLSILQLD